MFLGTIIPTHKKDREHHVILFLNLSKGALQKFERGWFWSTTLGMKHGLLNYHIQCTTWRDKKVMFLHFHSVRQGTYSIVLRHIRGAAQKLVITGPSVQKDYVHYYLGVDRSDRDNV